MENKQIKCPKARQCGGCQLQGIPYEKQLEQKQKKTEELIGPYCRVFPITGMEDPFHYRNKVHAVLDHRKGKVISGIYAEGSHRVVPVDACLIEDEKADEIIVTIRELLQSFKLPVYDEDTGRGLFRHILIRVGKTSGQIMVVLVMASPVFPSKNNFIRVLRQKHPEITTIVQNINDQDTSMVLGDREKVLYGKGYITDTLCKKTFRISSRSFYQINPVQTEKLYQKAIHLASLTGKERIVDAYCGIGTIGLIASDRVKQVIGIELNEDAIRDAMKNAKANGVTNVEFYCDDAGDFMREMAAGGEKVDVVFMDPPRSGSDEVFLASVVQLAPKRVVYISCNPETMARDLSYLTEHGYRAITAWPFDMFPHTQHCETVVLLSQRKADDYIEIDLDLDEMDITSAETKATYREVQQYVLQTTGLMVSNLNIAQIKDKCGFDKRENYNKPRTANARQPKCTPEKEKAIMDAFRHFGMI